MSTTVPQASAGSGARARYRHEALFYSGQRGFLASTAPFIRDSVEAGEPILVVVDAEKIAALRDELRTDVDDVSFANMSEVGANPARIIPVWQAFVDEHSARFPRLRGIGEPIFAERSPAELEECQLYEALLNVALVDPNLWLMCPYDVTSLEPDVLAEARRSHPFVQQDGRTSASDTFSDTGDLITPLNRPLPDPPPDAAVMAFDRGSLAEVRNFVSTLGGRAAELSVSRTADLVLAVNEIATNSLVHGGGHARLLLWLVPGGVVCEIRDLGTIDDPLVGRVRPAPSRPDGRGIWLANQLCDLVQIRSSPRGTHVRLHVHKTRD